MNSKSIAAVIGFSCALAAATLYAADPWDAPPFSADAKSIAEAVAKLPEPDDLSFEILLNEATYVFDEQGRCQTKLRLVYRVLTEQAARSAAFAEASWAPWHQDRATLRARVISPAGKESNLDAKHVAEVPDEQELEVLTDRRRLRAPLPAVRAGAIIEREIVVQDTRPFFEQGTTARLDWDSFAPQRLVRLTIDAPAKLPLRYETRGFKLEPRRTEQDGRVKLVFESGPIAPRGPSEPLQPAGAARFPHIVFSTGATWEAIAKAYHALVEKQLAGSDVKPIVADLMGKGETREQLAAKLLARLNLAVRYTALSFGEAAIVPRPPAETLERQFGDCKDQSALLVAMLRAAGVEAHVALLHSGLVEEMPTDLPGLGAFNHAIVYVPGEPPLWIDPTSQFARIGELPLADQGKPALVASADSKGLVRTPVAPSAENRYQETQEVDLSNPSAAKVKFIIECRGTVGQERRNLYTQQSAKAIRKQWEDFFQQTFHVKDLSKFSTSDMRDLAAVCRVEAEAGGVNFGSSEAGSVSCAMQPLSLIDRLPFMLHPPPPLPAEGTSQVEPRKTPLSLIENHVCEMIYRYVPPAGFTVGKLPANKQLAIGPATLSRTFEVAPDNVLTARFRLDTGHGRFTAAEVEAFRAALAEISTNDQEPPWNFTLTFEMAAARLSGEGKHREAFDEFHRLLAKRPADPSLRMQYATALLRAGFGEAARSEARKAVELDPKSAEGWHQLGFILTHNTIGRHFQPGLDIKAARAAYEKGLELAPDHQVLSFNHAILLERDQDGQRLTPGVKTDESLDAYRKAATKFPANGPLRLNFLLALLDNERFEELAKETGKQPLPQPVSIVGLGLAAMAIEKGVAAAKARAATLAPEAEVRRNLHLVTGDYLLRARKYSLARELWEAGATGAPNEAQIRRLMAAVSNQKRHEELLLKDSEPASVVQQLYLALHRGGQELRDVRRLFANPPAEPRPLEEVDALREQMAPTLRALSSEQVLPARRADALSFLQFTAEGDDATAHRVRARFDNLPSRTWFVVKREGLYKLWCVGPEYGELGAEAGRALAAGNLDLARQYLKWAYDELRAEVKFFDPYAGTPFARLWSGSDATSKDDLELAAAALWASNGNTDAVKLLLAAREKSTSDLRKLQIDRALMLAGAVGAGHEVTVEAADRILAGSPRAFVPFARKIAALEQLGRTEEAVQLIRRRAEESPGDLALKMLLGKTLANHGEYQEAEKVLRPLAVGRNASRLANDLAWNALFLNPVPAEALADANRALEFDSGHETLHTLATVYAEFDKPAESRETLLRAIEARGNQLHQADHYVLGRLAERYGLAEVAQSHYSQVQPEKMRGHQSTWHLAQRRLVKK